MGVTRSVCVSGGEHLPLQSHVFIDYAINERLVIISFRKTSIY